MFNLFLTKFPFFQFVVAIGAVLCFIYPISALGALSASGTVPVLQPLQPAPTNEEPNFKNNIQTEPQAPLPGSENYHGYQLPVESDSNAIETVQASQIPTGNLKRSPWLYVAVLAVLAVLVGLIYVRKSKN